MKNLHLKSIVAINFLIIILISFFTLQVTEATEKVEASSSIAEVTVYPDRAIVTRVTRLELKKGDYKVAFMELPSILIDNSVRVSGRGDVPVRLYGTEVKRVFLKREPEGRILELKNRLKQLKNMEQSLKDSEDILVAREKFLDSIQIHAADQASKELKIQKMDIGVWEEVIRFLFSDKESTRKAIREAQHKLSEVEMDIKRITKELNQIQSLRPLEKKTVFIDLETGAPGIVELSVSYMVQGARWSSMYDARFDPENETLKLTQYGMVRQNTGEDWNDVILFLSTAQPALGASAPELNPWYLRVYSPRPPQIISRREKMQAMAPSAVSKEIAPLEEDKKTGALEMESELETAVAFPRGTSILFRVPKKENIDGNGQSHKTTIAVNDFKPSLEYHSVPKLSPHAFLKATTENSTEILFLEGPVNVFYGPDFVGSTKLPLIAPNEKIDLQLGVDSRLKVSRKLLEHLRQEEGVFKKNRKLIYGYLITVENFTDKEQTIYVKDQLPVSQDEKIKVETLDIDPDPLPGKQEDQGILTWKIILRPKEKSQIKINFSIEFPQDIVVQGI